MAIVSHREVAMYTLAKMQVMKKAGEGRIYWFYEDRTYGSIPEPIWVPKHLVSKIFGEATKD